jgi:hypothetical protein
MNLIALFDQELCKIGFALTCNSCDESCFLIPHWSHCIDVEVGIAIENEPKGVGGDS